MVEAVPLRDAAPLTDIAGCLRELADQIAAGEIAPRSMIVVWDSPVTMVNGACYGAMPDRFGVVGMLATATSKAATGAWS